MTTKEPNDELRELPFDLELELLLMEGVKTERQRPTPLVREIEYWMVRDYLESRNGGLG